MLLHSGINIFKGWEPLPLSHYIHIYQAGQHVNSADSNHQMCLPREIWFTTPQAAQITLGSGPGLLQGGLSALAEQAGPTAELRITSQKIICCCLIGACYIFGGS